MLSPGYVLLVILGGREHFKEKELKKINQKEFWVEKVIKRKGDLLYAKWFLWHSWTDKKDSINELFKKPKYSRRNMNVKLDWYN